MVKAQEWCRLKIVKQQRENADLQCQKATNSGGGSMRQTQSFRRGDDGSLLIHAEYHLVAWGGSSLVGGCY
jgi:hypothetical protein